MPRNLLRWFILAAASACLLEVARASEPEFGPAAISLCGRAAPPPSDRVCGLSVVAEGTGPQVALRERPAEILVSVEEGEEVVVSLPLQGVRGKVRLLADVAQLRPGKAEVCLGIGHDLCHLMLHKEPRRLEVSGSVDGGSTQVRLTTAAADGAIAGCDRGRPDRVGLADAGRHQTHFRAR